MLSPIVTHVLHTVFWICLGLLLYAYFGYPLLLLLLGAFRGREAALQGEQTLPSVSLVIAAFNEARVIAHKIENSLSLDYPRELLETLVVSDASTDATDEIAHRYAFQGVRLIRQPQRMGKTAALNMGVPAAQGEIVVLSDANAMYEPQAVRMLVSRFADERVGVVSGQLRYRPPEGQPAGSQERTYWLYEESVKRLESRLHSLLGANGSIYAIRRALFEPIIARRPLVDDFTIPFDILLKGWQAVLEPRAVSWEAGAPSLGAEYRRKVRIMARAITTMLRGLRRSLNPPRPLIVWQLISHKLLREVQAVFFVGMLVSSGLLAAQGKSIYMVLLGGQALLYFLGALGTAFPRLCRLRPVALAGHISMIVLASIAALLVWASGRTRATWQPRDLRGL
jgi:cellulose synthase/poly-beta-1,6-N-acetylglucosamine synthase-like glycosyltransferase